MKNLLFLSFVLLNCVCVTAQNKAPKTSKNSYKQATDIATNSPKPYPINEMKQYKGIDKQSVYLTMRDGVKIAVDIYLPKNLEAGAKLPTLVRQTRYWRSPKINFPFSLFTNGLIGRAGNMIKDAVEHGYAIVNVDARGSGASFGNRAHPWTPDEVKDGYEILDWIIKQNWSDGNIGSLGVSYGGTTAEFLATTKHPNLKAVALMFSLFDVYEDNAFPGGVHNEWFTSNWGRANDLMDKDKLPIKKPILKALVGGVSRVKTPNKKALLKGALKDHKQNLNVHDGALTIDYRNESTKPNENGLFISSIDVFSPHAYINELNSSGVAVYSYSGWMDGAYQNAAMKRHINLTNPDNKLIIGPWEHGGAFNISPTSPTKAGFNHMAELLKFFDFHLKGIDNGLNNEPAVHYFTLAKDKWQSSDNWPPKAKQKTLFFNTNGLEEISENSTINVKTPANFGTGEQTRWKAVNGKVTTAKVYYDWNDRAKELISFDSAAFEADTEITGHPLVELHIATKAEDAAVIVYLQDIDEAGKATYITEGLLRISHRKISDDIIYKEIGPSISHKKEDALPLEDVNKLTFDLIPCSYQIKAGHKVRISIASGDGSHFENVNDFPDLQLISTKEQPSKIILPIANK